LAAWVPDGSVVATDIDTLFLDGVETGNCTCCVTMW
jgi:hypothetical protein